MKKIGAVLAVIVIVGLAFSLKNYDELDLAGWSPEHKDAVKEMIEKYGKPNESTPTMFVWHNNGPWKKTIIYKEDLDHRFPKKHSDYIQHFVNYKCPANKFNDIASYDGSIIIERTNGVMSVRGYKESLNILALNIANDIISGKKTVEEGREFFTRSLVEYGRGTKSDYTRMKQLITLMRKLWRERTEREISNIVRPLNNRFYL